jgi:hypothetical protein
MKDKARAFIAIGIAFLAIGLSGQNAFIGIGAAFLAIGITYRVRRK